MNEISFDLFDNEELNFDIETTVQKVSPPLEDLHIIPSGEVQKFKSQNYYGYDNVTVQNIELQEKEVMPTKEEQTIIPDNEYSGLSKVIINGDEDLLAENIKEGKEIFGVTGTAQTVGYEWEAYDPINIVDLLDNDKEEYEYKIIILLANQGTNEYTFKYSDRYYNSGDLIRFSDGGEITISGTQTYTFDESKDFKNSLGQKIRYFIVYKKSVRTVGGNKPSFLDDILMWYFKNCQVSDGGRDHFTANGIGKVMLVDKDCVMSYSSQNIATYSRSIEKYEMIDNITFGSNKSLGFAFGYCTNMKNAKLNLANEVTNLAETFMGDHALEDVLLLNCPNVNVNVNNFLSQCYSLKKIVAKPILIPSNTSSLISSCYRLKTLSGIDFSNMTSNWNLSSCYELTNIENVANINININITNANPLTHNSIMNLINAYIDLTGQTTKTLTIGTKNLLKISDEEKAIAINKNVTLA